MKSIIGLGLTAALLASVTMAGDEERPRGRDSSPLINLHLKGKVLDFTFNHGKDRRIESHSLNCKRDLYVYVPPCYDGRHAYPLIVFLHGIIQDEKSALGEFIKPLDRAIAKGKFPPVIVAIPDGSFDGNPCSMDPGSFFINGPRGDYQDWICRDVWAFMTAKFPIRPEAKAHILAGASMGGLGAFNLALKRPDQFGIAVGVMPALNLRWMNMQGNYMANFDPYNWGWRNHVNNPDEVVADFGLVKFRMKDFVYPVFGEGPEAVVVASRENPIELVDRVHLKNGEVDMFVGYAGCDEFNLDAQAESFIYFVQSRGIAITAYCDPNATHSEKTGKNMIPAILDWLRERLCKYGCSEPLDIRKVGP